MELKTSILNSSKHVPVTILVIIITTLHLQIRLSQSQQAYLNNEQLDCADHNITNGFLCNGISSSCTSYITFRSISPYNSPPTIAYLLNVTPSAIAKLNNISDVDQIEDGRLIVIPVSCSCVKQRKTGQGYYQHNANYTLKETGETYFSMANDTYQGLTTCQAMIVQNSYVATNLIVGNTTLVPLRCACPTSQQNKKFGTKFLLAYSAVFGDNVPHIAQMFGVTEQSIRDANELQPTEVIYPFNPILIPLKSEPINIKLGSSPPAPAPQSHNPVGPGSGGGSSKTGIYIGVGVGAGVLVIAMASLLAWCFIIRPSKKKKVSMVKSEEKGDLKGPESAQYISLPGSYSNSQTTKSSSADLDGFKSAIGSLTAYKFREIEKATGNFSDGRQIKGSVYRGEFNGDEAAIKILKGNVPNDEINILKHINHYNIIRLSGYCIHQGNTYLVYEYAEKGSIDDWLFRQKTHHSEDDSQTPPVLSWKQRVQIACNVADALNYLHSYINPPYIHKNLKSSNILLDATNRAKITNFGLARTIQNEDESGVIHLTKHVVGTHGYLAPEYIENGAVTPKLDVFAFGVVILELLSGKPAVKPSGTNHGGADDLLFIVIRKVFEGSNVREKLTEFMDSNLHKEYPLDLAYSMAQLAHKCVDRDMNSRPSMAEVSMTLSKIYSSSLDWDPSDDLTNTSSRSHSTSI